MKKQMYKPGDQLGPHNITLVSRDYKDSNGHYHCTFICPVCGKHFSARLTSITSGNTRSCGCYYSPTKNLYIDLTNLRFGKLVVQKYVGNKQWLCKCDCGSTTLVRTSNLRSKRVISCGCIKSKGELQLKQLFCQMNINFESQKKFDTCRFPDTNQLARFDFYLSDYNILIEYHGQQHYTYSNSGWSNEEHFKKTQYRDNFKTQWCKDNNIPLVIIPYTEYGNLSPKFITDLIENVKCN